MQRYRRATQLLPGVGLLLIAAGCTVPTRRENLDATAQLVAGQVAAPLEWRLDDKADAEARQRAEAMLVDGLTLQEAIGVSFLASPDLQLALEKLEISRADFVAAATAPNPVAVIGAREPNGDLAAFYPGHTISFGVLQNVIGLLQIPGRRQAAKHDLQRARLEAANAAVRLAAQVAQAWIDYSAALRVLDVRQRAAAITQLAYDNLNAAQAAGKPVAADTLDGQRRDLLDQQGSVIRARLDAARTRVELGEKLGIAGWRDDWSVQQPLPPLPATDPQAAAEEQAAMGRRLDLLADEEMIQARLRVLANTRRFRWLSEVDLGLFQDEATGGTHFTGPNAVIDVPLFDQRQSALLNADAQLRSELRTRDAARLAARSEIRSHAAEMVAARELLEQIEQQIEPLQRQQQQEGAAGADPDSTERLRQRLAALSTEEEHVDLLRDYWRARSALALAAGDWAGLSGLP